MTSSAFPDRYPARLSDQAGFVRQLLPYLYGGMASLLFIPGLTAMFLAVAILLVIATMNFSTRGYSLKKDGILYQGIAGMLLWQAGNFSDLDFLIPAGITFSGAAFFNAAILVHAYLGSAGNNKKISSDENCSPDSSAPSPSRSSHGLIHETEDGGYEISIHELAAYLRNVRQNEAEKQKPSIVKQGSKAEPVPETTLHSFCPESKHLTIIFENFIKPWFREPEITHCVVCMLRILDEYSDSPSVVMEQDSHGQGEPYNLQYQTLHRVTLSEHTLHVVQAGFSLIKEHFGETGPYTVWPRLAITVIGHDLGKIPEMRAGDAYARLDHAALSAEIVKDCCKAIPGLSEECAAVIMYHHSEPPVDFAYRPLLDLLKEADARARRKELRKELGHLKPWHEIPLDIVAEKMLSVILDIIRAGDTRRDLFYLDQRQGIIYLNPDVFTGIMQEIAQGTYLWPEIYSPDSRIAEQALRDFMQERMKPAGWLTENFSHDRFLWRKTDKQGKVTSARPFVEIVFMKFVQAAGVKPSVILHPWRKSFLMRCNVIV